MGEKKLNVTNVERAMEKKGLNAAAVAGTLGVSRTIVSEWLRTLKLPRPRYLLELAKLLELSYEDIVILDPSREPLVAFRKHGNAKIRAEDKERAKELGRATGLLVPYFPFRRLSAPARLISPKVDPDYIEEAALETRAELKTGERRIDFQSIIDLFAELKTVIVPVLWGEKDSLDNALHAYLPDSQTTIVYLNLDTKLVDFKFWMLHELAHAKTVEHLDGKEAELFADAFASAVLVPRRLAEAEARALETVQDQGMRIQRAIAVAEELTVSPITIAKRVDAVARSLGMPELFGQAIFGAAFNFGKECGLVSSGLFETPTPTAKELIRVSEEVFKTPIYAALKAYLADHTSSEGIISACLGVPPADAKAILGALA
jgi:transcriptional regulator with XRE-family HTH domain